MGIARLQGSIGLVGTDQADEDKYRRFTQKNIRDLSPMQFKTIQEMSFYQWQRFPLAHRMIEIITDFCIGDDFGVKVRIKKRVKDKEDEDTGRRDGQQVWDDFFFDPVNHLDEDMHTITQDGFLNGELVLPAFVNDMDGTVLLGYMDPAFIKEVVIVPGNAREIDELVMVPPNETEQKKLKVIRYDQNPKSESYRKLVGEAFFFRLNYVMTQTRGHGDLTQQLDWLDAFEQFLFGVLDGFDARNAFFYDVTLEGATEQMLKKTQISRPKQGEVVTHNEKAKYEVKSPSLNSVDASEATRLIRNFIIGTKGWPDHFFGEGSDVNLATAQVMSAPTIRMVKRKQNKWKKFIKKIALFVLQQRVDKKKITLAADEYFDIEVSMFNIDQKDSAVIGSAFVQLVTALRVAAQSHWITDETAQKVVNGILGMLGIEPTLETPAEIKEQKKQREDEEPFEDISPISDFLKPDQDHD